MITMDGYRLFYKERLEESFLLYVKENVECIEVNYSSCGSSIECFWIKIKGVISEGDLTVSIYYQPPNQDNMANETIFAEKQKLSLD